MSTSGAPAASWRDSWRQAEPEGPLPADELAHRLGLPGSIALVGLLLLGASCILLMFSMRYVVGGEATYGLVVDFAEMPSKRGRTYAPIVAYPVNGETYEARAGFGTSWSVYDIGDDVTVLYMPGDPRQATINDFHQLYMFPSILGVPGLLMLLGGVGFCGYVIRQAGWRLLPSA
jgi:hypothetical protein